MDPTPPPPSHTQVEYTTNTTTTTTSANTVSSSSPPIKPILTSSSFLNNTNILFNFERKKDKVESTDGGEDNNNVSSKKQIKKQQKEKNNNNITSSTTTTTVSPKQQRPCKICNKKNHHWKNCPTPDINKTCSNCNKIGHVSSNCNVIILKFQSSRSSSSSSDQPKRNYARQYNNKERDSNKDNNSNNNNDNNKFKDKEHSTTTKDKQPNQQQPKQQHLTSSPSSSQSSPLQPSPVTITSTTTTTTTSNIETSLKFGKPLLSEQIYLADDNDHDEDSDSCLADHHSFFNDLCCDSDAPDSFDHLITLLKQCNVKSICIPMKSKSGTIFYQTDNDRVLSNQQQLEPSITASSTHTIINFIKKANANNILTPLSISVELDKYNLIKNPNWKQIPFNNKDNNTNNNNNISRLCLNNKEFLEYFNELIEDIINRVRDQVGIINGIYFTNIQEADEQGAPPCICQYCIESMKLKYGGDQSFETVLKHHNQVIQSFKINISTLVRTHLNSRNGVIKNNTINQIIHFQSQQQQQTTPTTLGKESNVVTINYNSKEEFGFLSRYHRMGTNQTIGIIKTCESTQHPILTKPFSTLQFQLLYSMLLNGRCAIEMNNINGQVAGNHQQLHTTSSHLHLLRNHQQKVTYYKQLESLFKKTSSMETVGGINSGKTNGTVKILSDIGLYYIPPSSPSSSTSYNQYYYNVISILEEQQYQFDIIDDNIIESSQDDILSKYKLIIIPGDITTTTNNNNNNNNSIPSPTILKKLQRYQQEQGGSLLIFGDFGLSSSTKKSMFSNNIKYSPNTQCNIDIITMRTDIKPATNGGNKNNNNNNNNNKPTTYTIIQSISNESIMMELSSLYLLDRKGRIDPIGNDSYNILPIESISPQPSPPDDCFGAGIVYDKKQRVIHAIHPMIKLLGDHLSPTRQAISEIIHQCIRILVSDPLITILANNNKSIKSGVIHQLQLASKQRDPVNRMIVHLINENPSTTISDVQLCLSIPKPYTVDTISLGSSMSSSPLNFSYGSQTGNVKQTSTSSSTPLNTIIVTIPQLIDFQTILIDLK